MAGEPAAIAEKVARESYGKLVAYLAAPTRDLAGAEDALSEAFSQALAEWPAKGVPARPEGWLLTVARRRMIDAGRRQLTAGAAAGQLQVLFGDAALTPEDAPEIPDHRLRLMFACAHPAVEESARAPLMLQTILGFDAGTIASAFLVTPATMSQRLVRAKARIRENGIPFVVPEAPLLRQRLGPVLEAIYAIYSEGWADPAGAESRRRDLAGEAIWLGRLVLGLLPNEPEALGLMSLMLFTQARAAARRDANGDYVPLQEQKTFLWDINDITEAESLLRKAGDIGIVGRYQVEAAIQSAHIVRLRHGVSDWRAIAMLYGVLLKITGSPVVALNRAVAIGETEGAEAGLAELEGLAGDERLRTYQPFWAARASLLAAAGRKDAAREAYDVAIGLETEPGVKRFLARKQAALA